MYEIAKRRVVVVLLLLLSSAFLFFIFLVASQELQVLGAPDDIDLGMDHG